VKVVEVDKWPPVAADLHNGGAGTFGDELASRDVNGGVHP